MKESELRSRLESMAGEMPEETHRAFLTAAAPAKEEVIVKKKMSTGLVIAIALISVALVALAASGIFDLSWYYDNRYTAYKDDDPETYEALMKNNQENVSVEISENSLLDVVAQNVSYSDKVVTVHLKFNAKDPEKYDLYGMEALDVDGSYMGPDGPVEPDSEERLDHWLWRSDEDEPREVSLYGPPAEIMQDPSKQLLLVEYKGYGDETRALAGRYLSYDYYRLSDGSCVYVLEFVYDEDEVPQAQETQTAPVTFNFRMVEYTEGMDDKELYTGGENFTVTVDLTVPKI